MGTGWVLLRQLERDRRASKFYATKYSLLQCKYSTLGTSLHIVSMNLQHLNCLHMRCAGSGVLLVSLRCLFVVQEGPIIFLSVGGCMSYLNKTCRGLVLRGIVMQLLGGMPLQQHWSAIYNNCRWNWQGIDDLLTINVGGTIFNAIRLWCERCSVCVLFDETMHCICQNRQGNNILQFGVYCMSGSCPLDVILLLLGWSNPSVAWERGSYAMIWTMQISENQTIGFAWHWRRDA